MQRNQNVFYEYVYETYSECGMRQDVKITCNVHRGNKVISSKFIIVYGLPVGMHITWEVARELYLSQVKIDAVKYIKTAK